MARPVLEIADIFRDHGAAWRKANAGHVSLGQLKVMSAIESCRTAALGGHVMRCEDCSHTAIAYNSCRNRHCPKCQGSQALAWMEERKAELLPVPYFHVVFTLPVDRGHRLPEQGRHLRSLVQGFVADNADDCGRSQAPGRQDRLHVGAPHLGLRDDASPARAHDRTGWRDIARRHTLDRLPSQLPLAGEGAVAAVPPPDAGDAGRRERRRPPAVLRRSCPPRRQGCVDKAAFKAYLAPLHRTKWFVYSKRPFAGPEQVLAYLSRYTHRVAISNSRLIAADETGERTKVGTGAELLGRQ